MSPRQGILFCGALCWLTSLLASAQMTHYSVKWTPDFERHILHGEERMEFSAGSGITAWQKKESLKITEAKMAGGEVTISESGLHVRMAQGGNHVLQLKYEAAAGQGLRWLVNGAGIVAAFYCDVWMVCDNSPGRRATLRLEVVIPKTKREHEDANNLRSEMRPVAAGQLAKEWQDAEGKHFVYEQTELVQTYLFSFGVARIGTASEKNFSIHASDLRLQQVVLAKTKDVYAFLREKADVDPLDAHYTQAFLPTLGRGFGQEAAGMALMSEEYLPDLTDRDDVQLMAHELAHQWWGVLVGIRSWSDFWLNEGFAEFMADAYIEKHQGRAAYERQIAELKERMEKLREEGKDRPLHWEEWKDAHEALGEIPYVKGALFLDRLRTELGEGRFWKGIGLYTSKNARKLVDSGDFQRPMEEASGRDLHELFDEAVHH